jgi:hypothetical protein
MQTLMDEKTKEVTQLEQLKREIQLEKVENMQKRHKQRQDAMKVIE